MIICLFLALLSWNLLVAFLYALDKVRAQMGAFRLSERLLLSISLFVGGTGAMCAALLCHHKTKKWYFWAFWLAGEGLTVFLIGIMIKLFWKEAS